MANDSLPRFLRHLRRLLARQGSKDLSDGRLLQLFIAERDEAAFAILVSRHGPLVLGVGRRILHDQSAAEDVFQATFLVLAKKARSIRKQESLASWLYGIAHRLAVRAKAQAAKRQSVEQRGKKVTALEPSVEVTWRELGAALDDELARLADKHRAPLILCYLEGLTQDEAARQLGWPTSTLRDRLARGRELLRDRLEARGFLLSTGLLATALSQSAASGLVSTSLLDATIEGAVAITMGETVAAGFSAEAIVLAKGALQAMFLTKIKIATVLAMATGLLGISSGAVMKSALAKRQAAVQETEQLEAPAKAAPVTERKPAAAKTDLYGDQLPEGAVARLGTLRQRAADSHLALTADGNDIVTIGPLLTVRRFDARTGVLRAMHQLPREPAFWAWLSPHGTYVLTVNFATPNGYQLELWDTKMGVLTGRLSLSGLQPESVSFSLDERLVAVADSDNGTLRILMWDLKRSKSKVLWSEKKDPPNQYFEPVVVFSATGNRLVACHLDLILRCWEVDGGRLLWESKEKNWSPFVLFSPDGQSVVAPSGIGIEGLIFRDATTGKTIDGKRTPPKGAIYPIGFSPDGRFLAFEDGREGVILWEPGAAQVALHLLRPSPRGHAGLHHPNRMSTNFAFTPDSRGFIRRFGAIERWDLNSGKPVYTDTERWGHTEEVTRVIFSPDGKLLASSAKDQTARLWDVATASTLHAFPKGLSDHLAFTTDGRHVLLSPPTLGKTLLRTWDVATGREARGFELADRIELSSSSRDKEIRVSSDGMRVSVLTMKNGRRGDESMLSTWNAATGECLIHKRVPWSEDSVLMPDGKTVLAFDSAAGVVRLLAVDTEKPRVQFEFGYTRNSQKTPIGCYLAVAPSGRLVAARIQEFNPVARKTEYDAIRVGDVATARQLLKVPGDGPAVMAFSADDRLFAIARGDSIGLWETYSWSQVGSIMVHKRDSQPPGGACATALAFSPDARTLATGHVDSTILLWDATLRDQRKRPPSGARESLWTDLAGADAKRAYAAIWCLVEAPDAGTVTFLRRHVKPAANADVQKIRQSIADLDSESFAVREKASKKLEEVGSSAVPAIREALTKDLSAEVRRRLEIIVSRAEDIVKSAEILRDLRAIQVLEYIGSGEACDLLKTLAQGAPEARPTREAKASLDRMTKGSAAKPWRG